MTEIDKQYKELFLKIQRLQKHVKALSKLPTACDNIRLSTLNWKSGGHQYLDVIVTESTSKVIMQSFDIIAMKNDVPYKILNIPINGAPELFDGHKDMQNKKFERAEDHLDYYIKKLENKVTQLKMKQKT